jgi:S-DNA-T family DNA segregation ATPase FtsK/SpoIIIE
MKYEFPPIELLNPIKQGYSHLFDSEVRRQCRALEQTLEDFRVDAKVVGVTRGPSVTRYELEPARGVKVSSIINLADDLALRLAAPCIRIVNPVPGKATIGIEAPNTTDDTVSFREMVSCEAVRENPSKLCVGLGKGISGNVVTIDLSKMPHLLMAGTSGSGVSACVNTLLGGVLYKARPDEVKLVLIDPKVTELTNYNGLPHLLFPVITDAEKAVSVLHWLVAEMERRYKIFEGSRVRDIKEYNAQAAKIMPYFVIVINEMYHLTMADKEGLEKAILLLAQKSRATGIHLVLTTQRPSVNVVTGWVKANIPSRIAFAVSSTTDSRTILNMAGAEKLLGRGDMLFYPIGASSPLRVQGAYISDEELDRVIKFIKQQEIPAEYCNEFTIMALPFDIQKKMKNAIGHSVKASEDNLIDGVLDDAVGLVMDLGMASASVLQRRFHIDYERAERLIEMMEEMGIIGLANGEEMRELRMTRKEVEDVGSARCIMKYINMAKETERERVATEMLKERIPLETIIKVSKLSEERIRKLAKSLGLVVW